MRTQGIHNFSRNQESCAAGARTEEEGEGRGVVGGELRVGPNFLGARKRLFVERSQRLTLRVLRFNYADLRKPSALELSNRSALTGQSLDREFPGNQFEAC